MGNNDVFSRQNEVAKPLSVGFILAPQFTLSAFSNFIDALRLAADDGDFSRQIRCKWKVLSHDAQPIASSCGLEVIPTARLEDPKSFDYIVVVGGLLHAGKKIAPQLVSYLKNAAESDVPLVGVCTGSFILARTGLMQGRNCCVSWFHHQHFETEFPKLSVSSDELFIIDDKRMTCAGGAGVMHLAAHIIEKHCGKFEAARALRIMLEEMPLPATTPQPQPVLTEKVSNLTVRKAMLLIERNISSPLSIEDLARKVNVSLRQLERLFHAEVGMTPANFSLKLRLNHAKHLLLSTKHQISYIVFECGFINTSHFTRRFRAEFGVTPTDMRNTGGVKNNAQ
ncbi:GlxA family transcriptional regulator [Pseudogulbenkiania sp. MAI-1]|uniref:GlxA family transcriptional regulator n=1 Tax=Pseudogulbenkiania sp. MAI-1 TaxID=990370 RepID=UPI0004B519F7|nr:GlxA family transcriptional regulator [Pseudogulbenkiania sp. MAI-1]